MANGIKKTDLKTDDIDKHIISLIANDKNISIPEISRQSGKGGTAIKVRLMKLKKAGIICRIGPAKGGHWVVISN
jgi:ATP-dependent DNA helicase RecG